MMRKTLATMLIAASLGLGTSVIPAAAITVFDPSNYAQNVIQAARALQQINNQIQALQNQTVMLQNMARHLETLDYSSLGQITGALQRIDGLMNQAAGIAFEVSATDTAFLQQFPEQYAATVTTGQFMAAALTRWRNSMSAYHQTMRIQAQVVENVQADGATLSELVTASQGAVGSLQAQQAANQLLALSTKQQLQTQNLMAAQYRAQALDQARKAQAEEAARAAAARFLGSGTAYTPR
ncbi:MAG: P-type conjugative transfer protein TrbJ [Immundisolibacter sp.]|uniref:P-type conjugative transfer protein TrbJ n=1 Tax=Immundisolibacter sp. TaxID=1934948 RepID=UPI003EE098AA